MTVERIAALAGVGKPTIYRHWPNAQAVAMDAFLESDEPAGGAAAVGFPLDALRRQLRGIAAQNDSELAKVFRNRFILRGREVGRALLSRAVAEGTVRADADLEVALDLIYAPLYFRLLIGHGPLDAAFTDALLDTALEGLSAA